MIILNCASNKNRVALCQNHKIESVVAQLRIVIKKICKHR